jgi:hypothetical protein
MLLKEKYLKYKIKYLKLKKSYLNIKGGNKPFLKNDNINLFNPTIESHNKMEPYLNPIYGLYMCESGFITNNYYLYECFKNNEISKYAKKIKDLSRVVTRTVQPTNEIITSIKPIDIGRYIAILFFCKFYPQCIAFTKKENEEAKISFTSINKKLTKNNKALITENIIKLNDYLLPIKIIKIKSDIDEIDEIDFHIILYCLWWILNNNEGIQSYYQGINDVIEICNNLFNEENILHTQNKSIESIDQIDMRYENNDPNSFEKTVLAITKKDFHVYTQEQALHFCPIVLEEENSKKRKPKEEALTYADCGEVTARNLINLICFESSSESFNYEILAKYEAIAELIEYYKIFDTFEKQSTTEKFVIYGQKLNARDAWSKLIIFHANHNLVFIKSCNTDHKYELNSGMSKDGNTTNFFQLIKNFLPTITIWEDLNVDKTFEIISNETKKNGIGKIVIKANNYENITINCEERHYYMIIDKKPISYYYKKLSEKLIEGQKLKIKILLNDNTIGNFNNYIWVNWSSELLVNKINNKSTDLQLRKKLLELSFTEKFNSDTRSRIRINTLDDNIFTHFIPISKINEKINEYRYESKDFEFVNQLENLTHLNSVIINTKLKNIDLSSLSNLTSIGNYFMYDCNSLKNIDLSSLSNVESIGHYFMYDCKSLKNIDLTPLSKVTSIDHSFMRNCNELKNIDLTPLTNLPSIDHYFMCNCRELKSINLSSLSNLTSIGDDFMCNCHELENIDLSHLLNLKSIGNNFMKNCSKLEKIDLPHVSKITSIGHLFMDDCSKLNNIDLTKEIKIVLQINNKSFLMKIMINDIDKLF